MKKYTLAPYVSIGKQNNELYLAFGSIQTVIKDEIKQHIVLKIVSYLEQPHTLQEIHNKFQGQYSDRDLNDVMKLFTCNNLLIENGIYDRNDRFSRHLLFYNMYHQNPTLIQRKLEGKHVVIIGCGGIGNVISVNLATAGIRNMTLIDNDRIELSNLTRQILFTENDVGKKKTEILKQQLKKRLSNIKINVINEMLDSREKLNLIPDCDLIILSGDSTGLITAVNDYCFSKEIPFINVGYIQDIAVWGPIYRPGKTCCSRCFTKKYLCPDTYVNIDHVHQQIIETVNIKHQAPSVGPVNMLAGSLASLDIIKFLGGFGQIHCKDKRLGLWTHNLELTYQTNKSDEYCSICQRNNNDKQL